MDLYRLLKDELAYELVIRGISGEGTVPDLRKRLVKALQSKVPPSGRLFSTLPAIQEVAVCCRKVEAIKEQTEVIAEDDPNELKRLNTRLLHVKLRLERITELDGDELQKQEAMKEEVGRLLRDVKELQVKSEGQIPPMPSLSKVGTLTTSAIPTEVDASYHPTPSQSTREPSGCRDLKLDQWGLKYTADVTIC
uniref:Uncharacterized protein n=1 Tax=Rhodnius prolixus TaxID=13249 RepID=T1I834_RHOPR